MLRTPTLLLTLALAAGCASLTDPGSDTERLAAEGDLLSVDRTEYEIGDTVQVTLANRLDRTIGYNLCLAAREQWTGSSWRRIEPLRSCLAAIFPLEPGDATGSEEYTEDWEAGRYRIVTWLEMMEDGERVEAYSDDFTVSQ